MPQFPIDATVQRRLNVLEQLIDTEYGGSPKAFEARTGVKMAQVSQWFTGYRALRDKALKRLEECTGKPEGYFEGNRLAANLVAPMAVLNGGPDLTISQYDAAGAMGNAGLILEEKQPGIIKSWRVDQEWLRLNVRHHSGLANLCIVTGFGPSMQPKYNPGDPLLMDRGITTVESEGIFFFRVENHGFIKQLQRIPTEDGLIIRAKSLNKDYDPFDITKKMQPHFEVFGKILTVWKSEQV